MASADQERNELEALRERVSDLESRLEGKTSRERQQHFRDQLETIVSEISAGFLDPADGELEREIHQALDRVAEFSEADRAYAYCFDEPGLRMHNTHEWCREGIEPVIQRWQDRAIEDFLVAGQLRDSATDFRLVDLDELPAEAGSERRELEECGIQSLLCVPLIAGGRRIGFMGLDSVRERRHWSEDDVAMLRIVGSAIAAVLARRRTEEALRESEERLQRFYETAFEGVGITVKGRIADVNRRIVEMLGYERDELIGRPVSDLVVEEDRDEVFERNRSGFEGIYEHRCRHRDGSIVHVEVRGQSIMHKGEPARIANILDVTPRVLREREIARRRAELEAIILSLTDAMLFIDQKRRMVLANAAFSQLFGYDQEEIEGQSTAMLYERHEDFEERGRTLYSGPPGVDPEPYPMTYRRRDGSTFVGETSGASVRSSEGPLLGFVAIIRDKTRELELERQIRQGRKLEAIGTLAGGIAHDFNNLLAPIVGYAEILLSEAQEDDPQHEDLTQILAAAGRAQDLVEQILTFGRPAKPARQPLRLGAVVEEASRLLRATLPSTIEMRLETSSGRDGVIADPSQIHQVVVNLCTNAAHAMSDRGGVLALKVDTVRIGRREPSRTLDLSLGHYVRLQVSDDGIGMSDDIQERVFDPYFTTKKSSEGSGLGLAVVQGIVRQHQGAISVVSELSKGTTVEVLLPASDGEGMQDHAVEGREARASSGRILLVEDDDPVRSVVARQLLSLGYEVETEVDAKGALTSIANDPGRFSAILTDMTMPSMTGLELARRVREQHPDLPILLYTGFSESVDVGVAEAAGIQALLGKPLRRQELARALRSALGED